jgi:hypothetical protein
MLPEFDENGNLPPGIHHASFKEVVERFGKKSLKRQTLTKNLDTFYDFIKDFATEIYIDGSFTTNKLAPDDVDLLVILTPDFLSQSSVIRDKLRRFVTFKKVYQLHIFAFIPGRHDQDIQKMISWFTEDRSLNSKGIVYVEIGQ